MFHEFDSVALAVDVVDDDGVRYRAGRSGAIVDLVDGADHAIVDLLDELGMTDALLGVALRDLRPVQHIAA